MRDRNLKTDDEVRHMIKTGQLLGARGYAGMAAGRDAGISVMEHKNINSFYSLRDTDIALVKLPDEELVSIL